MLIKIYENIDKDTVLTSDNTYVIIGKIRVMSNIILTIEDNTNIMIMNGDFITKEKINTGRSCLIFEKGSKLYAERIYIQSCNISLVSVITTDNDGIVFLDSSSTEDKNSIINAKFIFGSYLDNTNKYTVVNHSVIEHFNDIVIDKANNKLNLKNISTKNFSDDGFDVEF
jgi:hypothetical protein